MSPDPDPAFEAVTACALTGTGGSGDACSAGGSPPTRSGESATRPETSRRVGVPEGRPRDACAAARVSSPSVLVVGSATARGLPPDSSFDQPPDAVSTSDRASFADAASTNGEDAMGGEIHKL